MYTEPESRTLVAFCWWPFALRKHRYHFRYLWLSCQSPYQQCVRHSVISHYWRVGHIVTTLCIYCWMCKTIFVLFLSYLGVSGRNKCPTGTCLASDVDGVGCTKLTGMVKRERKPCSLVTVTHFELSPLLFGLTLRRKFLVLTVGI